VAAEEATPTRVRRGGAGRAKATEGRLGPAGSKKEKRMRRERILEREIVRG